MLERLHISHVHSDSVKHQRVHSGVVDLRLSQRPSFPVGHLLNFAKGSHVGPKLLALEALRLSISFFHDVLKPRRVFQFLNFVEQVLQIHEPIEYSESWSDDAVCRHKIFFDLKDVSLESKSNHNPVLKNLLEPNS